MSRCQNRRVWGRDSEGEEVWHLGGCEVGWVGWAPAAAARAATPLWE